MFTIYVKKLPVDSSATESFWSINLKTGLFSLGKSRVIYDFLVRFSYQSILKTKQFNTLSLFGSINPTAKKAMGFSLILIDGFMNNHKSTNIFSQYNNI